MQQRDARARTRTDNAVRPILPAATVDPPSGRCASIETDLFRLSEPDARAHLHELVAALPHLEPPLPLAIVRSLIKVLAPLVAEGNAFTGADANGNTLACTPSDIMVHMNGIKLEESDYTASTTTVTLGSGAAAGDEVTITAFALFI